MRPSLWTVLVIVALAPAALSESGSKPQRPELSLRAYPRAALPPVEIQFIAAIDGGKDLEEYHCPEVEWDWDDGTRSVRESDCSPYEPGTEIERRYTAKHVYATGGDYSVSITLRRSNRAVAKAQTSVVVWER